jgi:hypothetical protein
VNRCDIVLERVSRVTPFGIRFVDEATGADVADPLVVQVYQVNQPERRVDAQPNRRGTFFVPRLPGPRDPAFDFGDGGLATWETARRRGFVVEVRDRTRQFQPFVIDQLLPAEGLAWPACLPVGSPPSERIPLFSTPNRQVPPGMAVIRSELRARVTMPDGRRVNIPAAWAVLAASIAGQPPVRGIADREGRVAIVAPYPEPVATGARPSSPPFASGTGLWDQEWAVQLEAFYQPQLQAPVVPELCRTLAQSSTPLWADGDATRPVSGLALQYGRDLIVPALVVSPAGPPT